MFDVVIEILHENPAENHTILDHTCPQHSARWSEELHPLLLLRMFGPPAPELACLLYFSKKAFNIFLGKNLSGFFPWDLPVVKISLEWVTGPEQGKCSGGFATFSLWTGIFWDGISSIPGETVIPLWLCRHFLVCENRVHQEKVRMTIR